MAAVLSSMTGFGRVDGADDAATWSWELRCVNGRGLDVRTRLPSGYERFEPDVRKAVSGKLSRGSVNVLLDVRDQAGEARIRINRDNLELLASAAEELRDRLGGQPIQAEALLGLRGVIETNDSARGAGELDATRRSAMSRDLETAVERLSEAREAEGARLAIILLDRVNEIEARVALLEAHPARSSGAIQARLATHIARILDSDSASFDADRLHQEAVLIATKADIEEELKRLTAHIAAARELVCGGGAVGRKLDFLTQEFNREANTICSKANDTGLTKIGLELKTLIDQVREQVQNVE